MIFCYLVQLFRLSETPKKARERGRKTGRQAGREAGRQAWQKGGREGSIVLKQQDRIAGHRD